MDIKKEIMRFFANQFETRTRDNGETFHCLGNNRPEWCQDIARECHGGLMPDNFRYDWLSHGADSLADIDSDDWADSLHEISDGLVEIYNNRLLLWISSNLNRIEYVNEAMENGLPRENDIINAIQAGQYEEITETLNCLISEIEEIADNAEPIVAGFNMCGYMPDSEPTIFSDFDDARQYIIDELKEREELADTESEAENYCEAAENVNLENGEFSIVVNGYAFWVTMSEDWLNNL